MIGGLIGESFNASERNCAPSGAAQSNPNLLSVIGLGINILALCSTASAGSF
jgi:hypothetical protein